MCIEFDFDQTIKDHVWAQKITDAIKAYGINNIIKPDAVYIPQLRQTVLGCNVKNLLNDDKFNDFLSHWEKRWFVKLKYWALYKYFYVRSKIKLAERKRYINL